MQRRFRAAARLDHLGFEPLSLASVQNGSSPEASDESVDPGAIHGVDDAGVADDAAPERGGCFLVTTRPEINLRQVVEPNL